MQELDFEALEKNLTDAIAESYIKLGYTKSSMGFYYPLESLNSLLGAELSVAEMEEALKDFCGFVKGRLGKVSCSHNHTRFCILIPAEGMEYVHETVKDTGFLRDFIEKIQHSDCGIENIKEVFSRYSAHVKCKELQNGEFDYLIYFEDGIPDTYRYCIKFEGGHITYHRFTQKDYEALGF
ncbi:DUF3877 family protein [Clostridium sp. C105KSO13]|uniref:DUF3877 family protein n=1 Tax=Clostridium sp. C105KSO13 TaxID=1776045 RepID=UPI0007407390|nr:DUF3877 family protein [Clostridium sp. C105KSO13]CUX45828.1 DUF based on E. rectale Gene description [Clostridium sp. C105KSO13]